MAEIFMNVHTRNSKITLGKIPIGLTLRCAWNIPTRRANGAGGSARESSHRACVIFVNFREGAHETQWPLHPVKNKIISWITRDIGGNTRCQARRSIMGYFYMFSNVQIELYVHFKVKYGIFSPKRFVNKVRHHRPRGLRVSGILPNSRWN